VKQTKEEIMMVHNRFNYNQNQGEGASFKRDSSADSLTRKEESVSRSGRNGGNDGGAAAGGGGGAAAGKSGFTIAKIIAIVALVLALIAMGLSIYCTLLWWDWPWVFTAPALVLAIAALIFAFAFKGHDEAVLCCAAIGAILALAALIWCSVEIVWCNSYQGRLDVVFGGSGGSGGSSGSGTKSLSLLFQLDEKKTELEKQEFMHSKGHLCKGRCYDWSYEKAKLAREIDCKRKVEKWFKDKYLKGGKISHCTSEAVYKGVDTYESSPIHLSHKDIVEGNKFRYPKDSLTHSEKILQETLDTFCAKFDVGKYLERRKECDDHLKNEFKPTCKKEYGGFVFEKGDEEAITKNRDACKLAEDNYIDAKLRGGTNGWPHSISPLSAYFASGVEVKCKMDPTDPRPSWTKVYFKNPKVEDCTPKELSDEDVPYDFFCKVPLKKKGNNP